MKGKMMAKQQKTYKCWALQTAKITKTWNKKQKIVAASRKDCHKPATWLTYSCASVISISAKQLLLPWANRCLRLMY